MNSKDPLTMKILKLVNSSCHPLEKADIIKNTGSTEIKVRYRLQDLRADGLIMGRKLNAGKGVWIFWRKNGFGKVKT